MKSNETGIDFFELAKMEAQIVRNYEILITSLMTGALAITGWLFKSNNSNLIEFFLLGVVSSTLISPLANGRSFHYALYEESRNRYLGIHKYNIICNLEDNHNSRKSFLCLLSFGVVWLPYWQLWPILALIIPIIAGLAKCLIGE